MEKQASNQELEKIENPQEAAIKKIIDFGTYSEQRLEEILAQQNDICKRNFKGDFIPTHTLQDRTDILSQEDLQLARKLYEEKQEIIFKQRQAIISLLELAASVPEPHWERINIAVPGSYVNRHSFTYVSSFGNENTVSLHITYNDGTPNVPVSYAKGYGARISFIDKQKVQQPLYKKILRQKPKTQKAIKYTGLIYMNCDEDGTLIPEQHSFTDDKQALISLNNLKDIFGKINHT